MPNERALHRPGERSGANRLTDVGLLLLQLPSLVAVAFLASASPPRAQMAFEDVTPSAGLSRFGETYACAWGDLDGDGYPDLYCNNHREPPALYLNNSDGTFTDVADEVITKRYDSDKRGAWTGDNHVAAWGDFDNDGDQDLIQINGGKGGGGCFTPDCANQFYHSEVVPFGIGREFVEDADAYGIAMPPARGRAPLWLDWNRDGKLDLFITNHRRDDPPMPSGLYTQTASGFENVSDAVGPFQDKLDAAFLADLTGDGRLDLVTLRPPKNQCVAGECRGYQQLYVYDMSVVPFREVARELGLWPWPQMFEDVIIADFNNDLLPDVFLPGTGGWSDDVRATDKLYINTGSGFEDRTAESGLGEPHECARAVAGDFDNDGDVDLYLVCGNDAGNVANILYENLGDARFVTVADAGGAAGSMEGRGNMALAADYDRDGFLDLFVSSGWKTDGPDQLFRNRGNANSWIQIDLMGRVSNRDGIGARVVVIADGRKQLREQAGGMHRNAQDHKRLHFGLGESPRVQAVHVFWPSGRQQTFLNVPVNRTFRANELGGLTLAPR